MAAPNSPRNIILCEHPSVLFARYPSLCSGILLFDILVANADRHRGNLKVDSPAKPRHIWIFDHDHALLGTMKGLGIKRLRQLQDRLGVSGGTETGETRHCLIDVIDTAAHLPEWLDRIARIPDWYIRDACNYAIGSGVGTRIANAVFEFIGRRRNDLDSIINRNRNEFPLIKDWPFVL